MAITRSQQAKQMLQDGGMLVQPGLVVLDKDTKEEKMASEILVDGGNDRAGGTETAGSDGMDLDKGGQYWMVKQRDEAR